MEEERIPGSVYQRMAPGKAIACDDEIPLEGFRLLLMMTAKLEEQNYIPSLEEMREALDSDEQETSEAFAIFLRKNIVELCASGRYRLNPQIAWNGDFDEWEDAIASSLPMHISPRTFHNGRGQWHVVAWFESLLNYEPSSQRNRVITNTWSRA